MSCALVVFSGWKTLIPRPWMCVGNVTVTLLELSMEVRHVHRYTLYNIHTYNLFKFDGCCFLSLPLILFTCVSSFRWEGSVGVRLL